MECVCLWKYNKEAKRSDVNYAAVTGEVCSKYASRMINRARKPLPMIPCFGDHCKEFDTTPVSDFGLPGKPEDDPLVKRVVLKKDDVIVPVHDSEESPSESSKLFQIHLNCSIGSLSIEYSILVIYCQNCYLLRK